MSFNHVNSRKCSLFSQTIQIDFVMIIPTLWKINLWLGILDHKQLVAKILRYYIIDLRALSFKIPWWMHWIQVSGQLTQNAYFWGDMSTAVQWFLLRVYTHLDFIHIQTFTEMVWVSIYFITSMQLECSSATCMRNVSIHHTNAESIWIHDLLVKIWIHYSFVTCPLLLIYASTSWKCIFLQCNNITLIQSSWHVVLVFPASVLEFLLLTGCLHEDCNNSHHSYIDCTVAFPSTAP